MNRLLIGLVAFYIVGFAVSLIGCSSDNIPKGTVRTGIGVPSAISLQLIGGHVVTGRNLVTGALVPGLPAVEQASVTPIVATVKDELGNPADGFNVIFTTNQINPAFTSVALAKGRAIFQSTFNNTLTFAADFRVTAAVEDISTSTDVLVNCATCAPLVDGAVVPFVP